MGFQAGERCIVNGMIRAWNTGHSKCFDDDLKARPTAPAALLALKATTLQCQLCVTFNYRITPGLRHSSI